MKGVEPEDESDIQFDPDVFEKLMTDENVSDEDVEKFPL